MVTLSISILAQNTANVTVANMADLRGYIATQLPGAKVTWCPDNVFVFPGNKDDENEALAGYLAAGDCLAMGDGFPAVNQPTLGQFQDHVDEFWASSLTRYGKTPVVATAWHYPAAYLSYLASKGVRTVTGSVWSQTGVDRFQGEGSRLFPFYPSSSHAFVPAASLADRIDIVSCNSLSPDPLGCRVVSWDSRWTLHPADPDTADSTVQKNIIDQAINSLTEVPLHVYVEVDWLYSNANILARFKELIDWVAAKGEDVEVLALEAYGEKFRVAHPDNSDKFGMIFQGAGITFWNSTSPVEKIQYWYEDQDGSVCLQLDTTDLLEAPTAADFTVEACVRYVPGIPESDGYFDFEGTKYKDFSYRVGLSYKYDQKNPNVDRVSYDLERKARRFHGIPE